MKNKFVQSSVHNSVSEDMQKDSEQKLYLRGKNKKMKTDWWTDAFRLTGGCSIRLAVVGFDSPTLLWRASHQIQPWTPPVILRSQLLSFLHSKWTNVFHSAPLGTLVLTSTHRRRDRGTKVIWGSGHRSLRRPGWALMTRTRMKRMKWKLKGGQSFRRFTWWLQWAALLKSLWLITVCFMLTGKVLNSYKYVVVQIHLLIPLRGSTYTILIICTKLVSKHIN